MLNSSTSLANLTRLVSMIASFMLVIAGVVVSAPNAEATTNTPIAVKVVDSSSPPVPIGGVVVNACVDLQSPNPTCVQGTTASNGEVTINFPLSSSSQRVTLRAGDWPTIYSNQQVEVDVTSGFAPAQTVLPLRTTSWLEASVQLVDSSNNSAPIPNEHIDVTATSSWGPIQSWATTNPQGIASFHLDANVWAGLSVTAVAGGIYSTYASSSATVTFSGSTGSATLSTHPLNYTLSGNIVHLGQPVANQQMQIRFMRGQSPVCLDFETDASGNYSVPNVSKRTFEIESKGCYDWSGEPAFDPISVQFSFDDQSVNQEYDFELHRSGVSLRVLNSGIPAPYVTVSLTSISNPQRVLTATSNSEGVATFLGLSNGEQFRASYTAGQNTMAQFENKTNTSVITAGAQDNLVPETIELVRRSSYPQTPVEIVGRVVTGHNSDPLRNATVWVNWAPQNSGGGQGINFTVKTNNSGEYRIGQLPFGQVNLTFNATGYRRTSLSSYTSQENGNSYNLGDINLRPQVVGDLSFSGVLKNSSGTPILDRRIVLSSADDGVPHETQTSSLDGTFSFDGLAVGSYYLYPDTWSDATYSQLGWNYSFIVLVESQSNVQVVLQNKTPGLAAVSGHVGAYLDVEGEESESSLEGLNVFVWPETGGQGFNAVTDVDGNWMIPNLTEGHRYHVSVQYPYNDYESPQQNNIVTARVSGGEPYRLLLKQISAGMGSLSGRVKDATNYRNLEGIQVNMYRTYGGFTPAPVYTNEKGEYTFTELPEGEYFLVIGDARSSYQDSYMSVEINGSENRVNALLTPIEQFEGTLEGVILDDRGIALPGASVQVWSPDDNNIGGYTQTDAGGRYQLQGIPTNARLNFKVAPSWDLRYEVASYFRSITFSNSETINVQLQEASFISGVISGIPLAGDVPQVSAELVDVTSGSVVTVESVDSEKGSYSLTSVPPGNYILRFTQRANYEGYNGGGWGFGGSGAEQLSLRPVYFDGTTFGSINKSQASIIQIHAGDRVSGKSLTLTEGSSIRGTVFVETPDGFSRLTGTRSVQITVFKKQADGSWDEVGYPESANGYSNSDFNIYGLGQGIYKLRFDDSRRGNNSLESVYNGGASSLSLAPEINVGEAESVDASQTLTAAPPERTAAAFDLDELGQAQLEELRDQIDLNGEISIGSEEAIYVGVEFAGEYVSAFANSTPTTLGGWKQVDSNGYIKVVIPADFVEGSHRIAVQDANLHVIGWSAVTVTASDSEAGVLEYSPRKAVSINELIVAGSPTKSNLKKSSVSDEESAAAASQNSAETQNNIWMMYVFGFALLLGIAGTIWLIRTRRS